MRGSHDGHRLQPRLEYREACGHNTGQEACALGVMVVKIMLGTWANENITMVI